MAGFAQIGNKISKYIRGLSGVLYFELSKINNDTKESESLFYTLLYTVPTNIHYTYPSRNRFTQTMSGGSLDKFSMGLPKIKISGTFGKMRRGLMYLDGLERLKIFKEICIKQYHITENKSGKIKDEAVGFILDKMGRGEQFNLKENEVYLLNFYDLINDEKWVVDPENFDINESARSQSDIPFYDLRMQAVGVPGGKRSDEILSNIENVKDVAVTAANLAGSVALKERFTNQVVPLWNELLSIVRG